MHRGLIIAGAVFALLGVAIGAFGAHGLAAILEANGRVDTFDTAVQYHLIHALALFIPAILSQEFSQQWMQRAGYFFIAGIALFSGSLYVLALFNVGFMGAIAPLGGTAFIAGWGCIAWAAWQKDKI